MKKRVIFLILTALGTGRLAALEIGGSFLFGSLYFETDRDETSTVFPAMTAMNYGGEFFLNHSFQEGMSMEAKYKYDPVLQSALYTRFYYRTDYISMGIGPYFGLFNNILSITDFLQNFETKVKPGVSAVFRFQYPGAVFIEMGADSTLGFSSADEDRYTQQRMWFAAGLFIPNAIVSLEADLKSYSQYNAGNDFQKKQSGYYFKADIYKKNVPVGLDLTIGYEKLSNSWGANNAITSTHDIHSVLFGTDIKVNATEYLTVNLDWVNSIYSTGLAGTTLLTKQTGGDSEISYHFRISTGFVLDLDYFIQRKLIMDDTVRSNADQE